MLFKSNTIITIDIGSSSIKVAKLKKKKARLELLDIGVNKLPLNTFKEGEILDISLVSRKLEQTIREMALKPKKVVTTISSKNIIIRNMEMPDMPEEELLEALKWEAEDYLPFPVQQASLDYLVIDKTDGNLKLLLVAVPNNSLDSFLEVFNRLEIKPAVINVQPMALLSLLQYQGNLKEPVVIIDIGASGSRVVIGDQKNIYLSRTIDIGGNEFTRNLVEHMNLDFNEAEKYKIKNGLANQVGNREAINSEYNLAVSQFSTVGFGEQNGLSTLADNLAKEISRSLEYYRMKFRDSNLKKIYITGGGSRLKGITEVIQEEISLEIVPINPFEGIVHRLPNAQMMAAEFAVPIGLAVSEVVSLAS